MRASYKRGGPGWAGPAGVQARHQPRRCMAHGVGRPSWQCRARGPCPWL